MGLMRADKQATGEASNPVECPRCSSTNTKFCYYNNYNKAQPRHFCKSCKRHWTHGGTLRDVPVGGRRKHKRPRHVPPRCTAGPPVLDPVPPKGEAATSMNMGGNACLIDPSFHRSLNDHCVGYDFESMASSSPHDHSAMWPSLMMSCDVDLPSYWSWREIDVFASELDLSMAWDDFYAATKP